MNAWKDSYELQENLNLLLKNYFSERGVSVSQTAYRVGENY
jgi:hypothetical protein